jgi:hypothetical protein
MIEFRVSVIMFSFLSVYALCVYASLRLCVYASLRYAFMRYASMRYAFICL